MHTQIHRSNFRKREIFPNIGHSPSHPLAVMNTTAARSQKRNDCFWRDKPVNQVVTDDRVWVGSRRCSVRVANGGFAALLEISCHSGETPKRTSPRRVFLLPISISRCSKCPAGLEGMAPFRRNKIRSSRLPEVLVGCRSPNRYKNTSRRQSA